MSDFVMNFEDGEEMNMGFDETQTEVPTNHNDLVGRDAENAHPISAINQLAETLQSHLDAIALKVNQTYVDGEIARVEDEIPSLDGYATETYVNNKVSAEATARQQAIASAIEGVTQFDYRVVTTLPVSGVKGTIYLVPKTDTEQQDIYDEYLWIENAWEHIGTTAVDLSDYYKKTETYNKTEIDAKETDVKEDIQELQTDVSDLESGKQDKATTGTFTLAVASWSNNQQTVNVTGVTSTSKLFVNPQTASKDDWAKYGIWGIAQADGTITFSCKEVPTVAINGQVVIL